ncbi:Bug family tripartite tricarboxylate transporter substrate binding protein [Leptothrix sp. BB-4]
MTTRRRLALRRLLLPLAAAMPAVRAQGLSGPSTPQPTACIVPAKPGGGFDLTCQFARRAWQAVGDELPLTYQPGGIGAWVYRSLMRDGMRDTGAHEPAGPAAKALVAWSSGTLLNLAQGRFGRYEPGSLHWVASLALDHGVVAVHRDSPWRHLGELLQALKASPASIGFAAGGTIGSQDWMKAALLARAAGVSHKAIRVVAFEGGGDAVQALRGRHVQVLCGDAAELTQQLRDGAPLRVLAVLARQRLGGALASVPTAREQGVELDWPILRGVYAGPATPVATATAWGQRLLAGAMREDAVIALRQLGLDPQPLAGAALATRVEDEIVRWRQLAREFGLVATTP